MCLPINWHQNTYSSLRLVSKTSIHPWNYSLRLMNGFKACDILIRMMITNGHHLHHTCIEVFSLFFRHFQVLFRVFLINASPLNFPPPGHLVYYWYKCHKKSMLQCSIMNGTSISFYTNYTQWCRYWSVSSFNILFVYG